MIFPQKNVSGGRKICVDSFAGELYNESVKNNSAIRKIKRRKIMFNFKNRVVVISGASYVTGVILPIDGGYTCL